MVIYKLVENKILIIKRSKRGLSYFLLFSMTKLFLVEKKSKLSDQVDT